MDVASRTLSVFLNLHDDYCFEVIIHDNTTSATRTFTQDTPDIEEKIGVEVMSWLEMMTYDKEE